MWWRVCNQKKKRGGGEQKIQDWVWGEKQTKKKKKRGSGVSFLFAGLSNQPTIEFCYGRAEEVRLPESEQNNYLLRSWKGGEECGRNLRGNQEGSGS